MKFIIAIAIAVAILLAGLYLYSGENAGEVVIAPLSEEAPEEPIEPAQPLN